MCTSISTAPSSRPEGLARFWPARRGAEPWMASNMAHLSPMLAEPARPTEPGDLRRHVGENVAVEVGHHDHVESFRRVGHLGRADVHDPVLVLDVRIFGGDLVEDLVEQTVGHLHDVVLHEAGDLLAVVAARVLEGVAHDLFAAGPRDQLDARMSLPALSWYSMPAYRSSSFSRTITTSMLGCLVSMNGW